MHACLEHFPWHFQYTPAAGCMWLNVFPAVLASYMFYNLFHHTFRMISDSFLATPEAMQIQSVTAATDHEQPADCHALA